MLDLADFEIVKKLGSGSFSSVYKVRRKSDLQDYAMKKVHLAGLSLREKQNSLNEVRILASLNSPYVIGYRESFIRGDTLFLILEYAGGGDLQQKIEYIRRKGPNYYFDEQLVWTYLMQMLQGLNALHQNNIYHRDIKCANVFLTADHKHIKLGDLNVAKVISRTDVLAQTQAGTPYYASPEVWKDEPYDSKCDIWSLGCVLYEMVQLQPPFLANDLGSLQKKIARGVYEPIHPRYSKELSILISKCLQTSPKSRATCQELLASEEVKKRVHGDSFVFQSNASRLLNTIYYTKHYKDISLPRPRYQTDNSDASLTNKRPSSRAFRAKSNNISIDSESPNRSIACKGIKLKKIVNMPLLKRSMSQNTSQVKEMLNNGNKENVPGQNLYQLPQPLVQKSPRMRKQMSSPQQNKQKLIQIVKPEQDFSLPPIEQKAPARHRKLSSKYYIAELRRII